MTVAIAPAHATTPEPNVQQLLMRLTGTLNRRRSYASAHPMVVASEQQLHESVISVLVERPVLTIGVMKSDLLIDGVPFVTRSAYARELALRLHRRHVGAITLSVGVPLPQLRELLSWLAIDPAAGEDAGEDRPPVLSTISVTRVAYDQLALGDLDLSIRASTDRLWRSLAEIAGTESAGGDSLSPAGDEGSVDGGDTAADHAAVLSALRDVVSAPAAAQRTAIAFMDLASQGAGASPEWRTRIGEQLFRAFNALGASSFGPIIRSLGERAMQKRFISQVVDVLPVATIANWLQVAAQAQSQQMSHYMLRLMAKLSSVAMQRPSAATEAVFRGAAQDLVKSWGLDDPNPEEHVALLDRIAVQERVRAGAAGAKVPHTTIIESTRLVQMALEIDVCGEDAEAAAEALIVAGAGSELIRWAEADGTTRTATRIIQIACSDLAIRQLLLNEPVDRLQARALLDRLDVSSAETLIDVLEAAEARGTRMIVRQRLADFGAEIMPNLVVRLDHAPWYLVRNILTLLHEIAEAQGDANAGMESMSTLLDHAQVQVRTEAFRLLLLDPRARDAAMLRALHDENERMVVLALQALSDSSDGQADLPLNLVTELMAMVDAGKQNDTVRARMVRTLAQTSSDTVRDWLLGQVVRRSRLLRRLALNEPTQTAAAALQVLQRVYSQDEKVQPVIALAHKHGYDRRWLSRDAAAPSVPGA